MKTDGIVKKATPLRQQSRAGLTIRRFQKLPDSFFNNAIRIFKMDGDLLGDKEVGDGSALPYRGIRIWVEPGIEGSLFCCIGQADLIACFI